MTIGLIDNTCVYEVVEALSYKRPEDCHQWAWKSAIEATCLIIGAEHLRLAPSPTQDGVPSGQFGQLLTGIADVVGTANSTDEVRRLARSNVKRWARERTNSIADSYASLAANDTDFQLWLEWFTVNVWEEHSQRLGGLFDPGFIPQIAKILGLTATEAQKLWEISADADTVRKLSATRPNSQLFRTLSEAYVVSALLRGRYHDEVARRSGWQIMHHPLRASVLARASVRSHQDFVVSSPQSYLANIILAASLSRRGSARISEWTEGVIAARQAWHAGAIDLHPKPSDEAALSAAIRAAQTVDIRCHSSALDRLLDFSVATGVGTLTSVLLSSWEGMVASAGVTSISTFVLKDKDPSRRVISRFSQRPRRLSEMAKAGPGRINRLWEAAAELDG